MGVCAFGGGWRFNLYLALLQSVRLCEPSGGHVNLFSEPLCCRKWCKFRIANEVEMAVCQSGGRHEIPDQQLIDALVSDWARS
jgi:hypothetical protein